MAASHTLSLPAQPSQSTSLTPQRSELWGTQRAPKMEHELQTAVAQATHGKWQVVNGKWWHWGTGSQEMGTGVSWHGIIDHAGCKIKLKAYTCHIGRLQRSSNIMHSEYVCLSECGRECECGCGCIQISQPGRGEAQNLWKCKSVFTVYPR